MYETNSLVSILFVSYLTHTNNLFISLFVIGFVKVFFSFLSPAKYPSVINSCIVTQTQSLSHVL